MKSQMFEVRSSDLVPQMAILISAIDAISVIKERSQTTEHSKAERNGQLTNREPNE